MSYDDFKVNVPDGQSGPWKVSRYTVTPQDEAFQRLRAAINSHRAARVVPAGTYTGLWRDGEIIMSDTPDEIRDHLGFIRAARGRLLIAGLGLGVVLQAVLRKREVEAVTVVEQSSDVIALVWPSVIERRVTLVNADIFTWKPPKDARYDLAWFDVWDTISADNLPEMARLHRRFARYAAKLDSWGHALCKHQRRRCA